MPPGEIGTVRSERFPIRSGLPIGKKLGSRRPGFSKHQLAAAVEAAGIRYLHLQALGTPPEGREAGRRREWDRFWGIVGARLASAEAELALHAAAQTARQSPVDGP